MPDAWATKAAEILRNQRNEKQEKDQRELKRKRLKDSLSPGIWQEIRGLLKFKCDALNIELNESALTFTVTQTTQAEILYSFDSQVNHLVADFDQASGTLEWRTRRDQKSVKLIFSIDDNEKGAFYFTGTPLAPEKVTEKMLNSLIAADDAAVRNISF